MIISSMLIFNRNEHKIKRKALRENASKQEKLLWNYLQNRRIAGYKFIRQYSIDKYVVDFYCPKAKLVIEIDGSSHDGREDYDKAREEMISSLEINILRFTNDQVENHLERVLQEITDYLLN